MVAPLRYRRECGPGALAAVAGLELDRAAELLWGHRRAWLRGGTSSGGALTYGTPPLAVADVLVRLGVGVELYDAHGRLRADVDLTPGLLARLAHEAVRSPVRRAGEGEEGHPPADGPDRGVRTPLSAWIDRHRAGWWIYDVATRGRAHLVACWGPVAAAGGPLKDFEDWTVRKALRVFPPSEPERGGAR